jgi:hypothetical protein
VFGSNCFIIEYKLVFTMIWWCIVVDTIESRDSGEIWSCERWSGNILTRKYSFVNLIVGRKIHKILRPTTKLRILYVYCKCGKVYPYHIPIHVDKLSLPFYFYFFLGDLRSIDESRTPVPDGGGSGRKTPPESTAIINHRHGQ